MNANLSEADKRERREALKREAAERRKVEIALPQQVVGRTIEKVVNDEDTIELYFTDGTALVINCFLEQGPYSDRAELGYDLS